ncbi:MAG: hypothetical protein ACTSUE_07415 [Promethearchaeota archaeon]
MSLTKWDNEGSISYLRERVNVLEKKLENEKDDRLGREKKYMKLLSDKNENPPTLHEGLTPIEAWKRGLVEAERLHMVYIQHS